MKGAILFLYGLKEADGERELFLCVEKISIRT